MEMDGGSAPQDGDGRRTRRRTDAGSSGPGLGAGDAACERDDDVPHDVLQLRVSIEGLFNDASLSDVAIMIGNGDQPRSFLCHKVGRHAEA